eukprot:scaffold123976_cov41-Attheya_sp.AAC.2
MARKSGQALDVLRSIRETDQEAHNERLDIMAASPPPSATFTLQDYDVVNTSNEDPASPPSVTSGNTSAFGKTHFVGRVISILGHAAPTCCALCLGCEATRDGVKHLERYIPEQVCTNLHLYRHSSAAAVSSVLS